jgi:phosphoglycolate phosphatase
VPTIGVAWGYAQPGELVRARKIVADVDELVDALTGDAHWSTAP